MADFASHETWSFIRLNGAFRKTLLQVAKKKPRKLTNHGKQLLPLMLISNIIVFYEKEIIVGNDSKGSLSVCLNEHHPGQENLIYSAKTFCDASKIHKE